MSLFWITDNNLGSFIEGQNFNSSPIILQYLASEFAEISLLDGELPVNMSWTANNGYVYLTGIISFGIITDVYKFTFRITELDGTYLDKEFSMNVISSPVPVWNAPSNLGTYSETYSFNLSPLYIQYGAILGAKVTLLNGSLPAGLYWSTSNNNVVITGESNNIPSDLTASWTFRITNPNGTIADRTFTMTITSLAVRPDWSGQSQFLGFVGSGKTATFTVYASVSGSTPATYSLVGTVPANITINSVSGLITYKAPAVTDDTNIDFTVRASTAVSYADLDFNITVLKIPHAPVWVTSNTIVRVPQQEYLEFPLVAFDPDPTAPPIVYSVSSQDAGFPFLLDSDGLIYGIAPTVENNQIWKITVVASNSQGNTSIEFTFEVTQVNTLGVLTWKNSITEILNIPDGQRAVYDLSATSTRKPTVKHGITGGQLPPGLLLDKIQGCLVGYVDYHMLPKDYWFDITATDDVDTIVKTFHLQVVPSIEYQFIDITMPLHGDVHQVWLDNNNRVFNNTNMFVNVAIESNLVKNPELSIVRGLDTVLSDPNTLLKTIAPAIQRMNLIIGSQEHTTVDSHGSQFFYRNVIDPQAGAATVALHNGLPPTINPNSLEGIRTAFIKECGYANGGGGSGATAIAVVEPELGSITGIYVITSGSGYINHPKVKINGTGSGASAYTMMKIIRMVVIDPGTGWVVGEQFDLKIGKYDSPARFVATAVDGSGGLSEVQFVVLLNQSLNGSYYQVPAGKILIRNAAGKLSGVKFELGVKEVRITNGGQGYDNTTTLDFVGDEILELWQSKWEPILPVALIDKNYSNAVINNSQVSILDGAIWQTDYLVMNVQGSYWQGTTSFNQDLLTWDGGTTRFEESLTPVETIFDDNDNTYDVMETIFDKGSPTHRDARDNWGETLIDEGTTAFDFYATIFDAISPPTQSSTLVRRLVRLSKIQISGNNIVDTKTIY